MDVLLRCRVFPGQFSSEFAVEAEQSNGDRFSLFVPRSYIDTEVEPTRDHAVDGAIRVTVWEEQGDKVIVKLPRESFESGRFVTVSKDQLREAYRVTEVEALP